MSYKGSFKREDVTPIVNEVIEVLKPMVSKIEICGSYRRGCKTIGDLDFIFTSNNVSKDIVLTKFYSLGDTQDISPGKKFTILYNNDKVKKLLVELVHFEEYNIGAAMMHFTGPYELNIIQRAKAKKKGWLLNQYGLFDKNKNMIAGKTENEIYTALDLPYITPEERQEYVGKLK